MKVQEINTDGDLIEVNDGGMFLNNTEIFSVRRLKGNERYIIDRAYNSNLYKLILDIESYVYAGRTLRYFNNIDKIFNLIKSIEKVKKGEEQ